MGLYDMNPEITFCCAELERRLFLPHHLLCLLSKVVALSLLFLSSSCFLIPLYCKHGLALYQKQNNRTELTEVPPLQL